MVLDRIYRVEQDFSVLNESCQFCLFFLWRSIFIAPGDSIKEETVASRKQGLSTNRDRDALRRELAVMKADLEDSRRREKELQVELERHCNSEEHYRHLTEHALRESEKKYHLLFDASPIGIGLADTEGKIIDANRSLLNITGYPPEELESIHIGDLYARPEDRRKILDELHREGAVRNAELEVQRRGERNGGYS